MSPKPIAQADLSHMQNKSSLHQRMCNYSVDTKLADPGDFISSLTFWFSLDIGSSIYHGEHENLALERR